MYVHNWFVSTVIVLVITGPVSAAGREDRVRVADLQVYQALVPKRDDAAEIAPQVTICFTLAGGSPVTVRIERHQNEMIAYNGPYLMDTYPVRVLELGTLKAGSHTVIWDGLDAAGNEVRYMRNRAKPPYEELSDVCNLFKIIVEAGEDRVHVNYRRSGGRVDTNRRIASMAETASGCAADHGGGAVFPTPSGSAYRYTHDWALEASFVGAGQAASPDGATDAAVDSHGDVYISSHRAVYRFSRAGQPAAWKADEDYINYLYPSEIRTLLGVILSAEPRDEKKSYVLGPGGSGHHKEWVTAEPGRAVTRAAGAFSSSTASTMGRPGWATSNSSAASGAMTASLPT